MATPIGTLGTIPTLDLGGRVFTDLTTIKVLGGYGAGGQFATLRLSTATSGYTVTNGMTLTLTTLTHAWVGGVDVAANLGYGDNDVGMGSAAAPTNAVWAFGDVVMRASYVSNAGPSAAQRYFHINQQTPAAKRPALNCVIGSTYGLAYGYEA